MDVMVAIAGVYFFIGMMTFVVWVAPFVKKHPGFLSLIKFLVLCLAVWPWLFWKMR